MEDMGSGAAMENTDCLDVGDNLIYDVARLQQAITATVTTKPTSHLPNKNSNNLHHHQDPLANDVSGEKDMTANRQVC